MTFVVSHRNFAVPQRWSHRRKIDSFRPAYGALQRLAIGMGVIFLDAPRIVKDEFEMPLYKLLTNQLFICACEPVMPQPSGGCR